MIRLLGRPQHQVRRDHERRDAIGRVGQDDVARDPKQPIGPPARDADEKAVQDAGDEEQKMPDRLARDLRTRRNSRRQLEAQQLVGLAPIGIGKPVGQIRDNLQDGDPGIEATADQKDQEQPRLTRAERNAQPENHTEGQNHHPDRGGELVDRTKEQRGKPKCSKSQPELKRPRHAESQFGSSTDQDSAGLERVRVTTSS